MNLSLSLREILHIVFKRQAFVKGCFISLVLAAWLGTLMRPTQYRAAGRILITGQEGGYEWLSLDNARIPPQDPDRIVNTEIEHIKSDDFLEKVADTLPFSLAATASSEDQGAIAGALVVIGKGVQTVSNMPSKLGTWLSSSLSGTVRSGKGSSSDLGVKPRNPSLWPLHLGLEVIPVPNTSLIEIAFTDTVPRRAAKIVNTILELYPPYRVKMYHDESAISFYDKQKRMLESEITAVEKQIEEFETKENIASVTEQREEIITLMTKAEDRLKATDAELEQTKARIATIERQRANLPERMLISQDLTPEVKPLRDSLAARQVEKTSLLQLYTEQDRRVQDKEREIAALKEQIAAREGQKVVINEHVGLNASYQTLSDDLLEQKGRQSQDEAKRGVYATQMKQLDEELDRLSVKGNQLTHLQEVDELKKEQLVLYAKKAEEARIADAMDKEKLINVKAVDPAPLPSQPVPTKGPLLLALAMFVGASVGVGGALALDFLNPTFHAVTDVERRLEIPVLALIPDLSTLEEKARA